MYSSLVCCCLLGNHLCLSICADPLLRWEGSIQLILIGSSPCPHQRDPCLDEGLRQSLLSVLHTLLDKPSRSTALILSLSLLRSFTDTLTCAHFRLSPSLLWSHLVGHPLPSPKLTSSLPLKHWLLACLCNFPFLPFSIPPYHLCPSFRAQLQPRSPGRPSCPRGAIGQPLWRVACIMHRCHCPPVQTPYVLRKCFSLAIF